MMAIPHESNLTDIRCPDCGKLLARAAIAIGVIEIMCKCKKVSRFTFGHHVVDAATDWHGLATRTATPHEAQARAKSPVTLTR